MAATTVLRWIHPKSDPQIIQTIIVGTEEQLALRNRQRLEQAKRTLGGRYVLHPNNKVIRQREERPRSLVATAPWLTNRASQSREFQPSVTPESAS